MKRTSALTLLLALLLACETARAEDVAAMDFCTLVSAPDGNSGKLVKVAGNATVGFEESSFTPSGCEWPLKLWLVVPDPGEIVPDRVPAGTRVIYGVTFEQVQAWAKEGAFERPGALPWQVAVEPAPLRVTADKQWRRFKRLREKRAV